MYTYGFLSLEKNVAPADFTITRLLLYPRTLRRFIEELFQLQFAFYFVFNQVDRIKFFTIDDS